MPVRHFVLLLWIACLLGCTGVLGVDCPAYTIAVTEAPPQSTSCAIQLQQYAHCTNIGDVVIKACTKPFNLSALAGLKEAFSISIDNSDGLSSLDGAFPSLVSSASVTISNNANLLSMTGAFPSLTSVDSPYHTFSVTVTVSSNPQLRNISRAFGALSRSGALVRISNNDALTDIDSFPQVPALRRFEISDNKALQSVRGFALLKEVDTLLFSDLPLLTSIDGLRRLRTAGLPSLDAFDRDPEDNGAFTIRYCALLPIIELPHLNRFYGGVMINTQDRDYFTIALHSLLMPKLVSAYTFAIDGGATLTTLDLSSLQTVQQLFIAGALSDLNGLAAVRQATLVYYLAHVDTLCCPSWQFFLTTGIPLSNIQCSSCITVLPASLQPTVVPSSGGVTFSIDYTGIMPANPIQASITLTANSSSRANDTTLDIQCSVQNERGRLLCPLPSIEQLATSSGTVQLTLSLNDFALTTIPLNTIVAFVPFAAWAGQSDASGTVANVSATSTASVSVLPGVPAPSTSHANNVATIVLGVLMGLAGVVVIVGALLLYHSIPLGITGWLLKLDALFVSRTRKEGEATSVQQLLRQASAEGGLFTVSAVAVIIAVLSAYTAQLSIDNTLVIKSYDPTPTYVSVPSDYSATATFTPARYFGPDGTDCMGWFDGGLSVTGFSTATAWRFSCQFDDDTDAVTVMWQCAQCEQNAASSNVSIVAPALNAFTRRIDWSFSTVDYFGHPFVTRGHMESASGSYFRGIASTVALASMSTNYTDRSEDTRTAKLIRITATKPGTQLPAAQFGTGGTGVGLQFTIDADATWFLIQLTSKQSAFAILAQLLAIIGGVLSGGRVMLAAFFFLFKDKDVFATMRAEKAKQLPTTNAKSEGNSHAVQLADVDVDVHINPAVRHSVQLQQAGAVDSASERIA